MIHIESIQRGLFSTTNAMLYLDITKRSTMDNLVRTGRLTPIKIAKENHFSRGELDAMIERELAKEKRLSGRITEDSS